MVLDWLSGGNSTLGGEGEQNLFVRMYNGEVRGEQSTSLDPPETPAHLFPLHAFKQAIFGTPKPLENPSAQFNGTGAIKPPFETRPTAGFLHHITTNHVRRQGPGDEPDSSPSKRPGILLTPGTGGQRRKTVSFGDGSHKPQTTFVTASTDTDVQVPSETQQARLRGQNARNPAGLSNESYVDTTVDLAAPRSVSGQYWKREYEKAGEISTVELRKLVKREQIAKRFAKQKDIEVQGLVEELQRESRKVARLETQLADYVARLASATRGASSPNNCSKDPPKSGRDPLTTVCSIISRVENQQHYADVKMEEMAILEKQQKDYKESTNMESANLTHVAVAKATQPRVTPHLHPSIRPKLPHRAPTCAATGFSSDIWANSSIAKNMTCKDIENGARVSAASNTRCHKLARSPLQSRVSNLDLPSKDTKKSRHGTLSTERREAAKRRLEEKRRARVAVAVNGQ